MARKQELIEGWEDRVGMLYTNYHMAAMFRSECSPSPDCGAELSRGATMRYRPA